MLLVLVSMLMLLVSMLQQLFQRPSRSAPVSPTSSSEAGRCRCRC
jgi:hypothetical protein